MKSNQKCTCGSAAAPERENTGDRGKAEKGALLKREAICCQLWSPQKPAKKCSNLAISTDNKRQKQWSIYQLLWLWNAKAKKQKKEARFGHWISTNMQVPADKRSRSSVSRVLSHTHTHCNVYVGPFTGTNLIYIKLKLLPKHTWTHYSSSSCRSAHYYKYINALSTLLLLLLPVG